MSKETIDSQVSAAGKVFETGHALFRAVDDANGTVVHLAQFRDPKTGLAQRTATLITQSQAVVKIGGTGDAVVNMVMVFLPWETHRQNHRDFYGRVIHDVYDDGNRPILRHPSRPCPIRVRKQYSTFLLKSFDDGLRTDGVTDEEACTWGERHGWMPAVLEETTSFLREAPSLIGKDPLIVLGSMIEKRTRNDNLRTHRVMVVPEERGFFLSVAPGNLAESEAARTPDPYPLNARYLYVRNASD